MMANPRTTLPMPPAMATVVGAKVTPGQHEQERKQVGCEEKEDHRCDHPEADHLCPHRDPLGPYQSKPPV